MAAKRSMVEPSKKMFELPEDLSVIDPDASRDVRIEELQDLAVMQAVSVRVKAIVVGVPEHIQAKDHWAGLTKQDCIVGDATGTSRLVLWEENVGALQADKCYKITDAHVKLFQGKKYLSVPQKGTFENIDDIIDVCEMDTDKEIAAAVVFEGFVEVVLSCEEYPSCVNCSYKILTANSEVVDWGKCFAKMKVSSCNTSSVARVILHSQTDQKTLRATIFDEVLTTIVREVPGATVSERLLCAPVCHYMVKRDIVVCAKFA